MNVVMVMSGGAEAPLIFGDLRKDNRVIYLESPFKALTSPILSFVRKVHLATRLNQYMRMPFRELWDKTLSLDSVINEHDSYRVLFIITSIVKYDIDYLLKLKKRGNIEYYLYMLDSVGSEQGQKVKKYLQSNILSRVYSFDFADCEQYGFEHFVQPMSMVRDVERNSEQLYDLYFLGRSKGRASFLLDIKRKCHGLKLLFKVISNDVSEKKMLSDAGVLSEYVEYEDNVRNILSSNVILELVQEGQEGNTLRYQEAILYNKKLLTNNNNVQKMPFYNEQYMRFFDDIADIDLSWVQQKEDVDYHYNGEFSPSRLVDVILKDI